MRNGIKIILAAVFCWPMIQVAAVAQEQPALTNTQDKVGYAIGLNVGEGLSNNLQRAQFQVNTDELIKGFRDGLQGHEPRMTLKEAGETIRAYQQELRKEIAAKNLKEGEAFLAENKTKPGVKTVPVALPDGKTAELQYKILKEGTGESPSSNDIVKVNWSGTLVNGKEFFNSAQHGNQPATMAVNRVFPGWSKALQMMKVGSKWELFLPPSLAYGERGGPGGIGPDSTLILNVELVDIESPKPAASAAPSGQPVTSDIIKVPSAEEMKKGAKIQVIKAEDAARMAAGHTNGAAGSEK